VYADTHFVDRLTYTLSFVHVAGLKNIVVGMPHRGRLNLLTDLLQYPPQALFHKLKGNSELPPNTVGSGDVLSHLANSPTLDYQGKQVQVSLLHNPSHLEAVNPVVMGKSRAKQMNLMDMEDKSCALGDRVLGVQLHGDAVSRNFLHSKPSW
jgi:probable 2-oxoglutarate dehydrogenase E1 component DHKTD1